MDEEIIQITPAPPNMWARLKQENAPDEFCRIVCFALVKDNNDNRFTYVSPMTCLGDGYIESAHFYSNFGGIVFSENPYEDYKED